MTIKELKKISLGRWDGRFRQKIVIEYHLGLLQLKDIVVTLKIDRWEFRRWVRWEYDKRVIQSLKNLNVIDMSKETELHKLQERIKALETKLKEEELKNEALNILINIGEEKYGMDLRKKNGAKQLKK